jgi:hypothetical protein
MARLSHGPQRSSRPARTAPEQGADSLLEQCCCSRRPPPCNPSSSSSDPRGLVAARPRRVVEARLGRGAGEPAAGAHALIEERQSGRLPVTGPACAVNDAPVVGAARGALRCDRGDLACLGLVCSTHAENGTLRPCGGGFAVGANLEDPESAGVLAGDARSQVRVRDPRDSSIDAVIVDDAIGQPWLARNGSAR